ncbi:hypothetical protein O6A27_24620 [Escherichia coli]|nr:hypothetical protein [Escherichia coli]
MVCARVRLTGRIQGGGGVHGLRISGK